MDHNSMDSMVNNRSRMDHNNGSRMDHNFVDSMVNG